MNNRNDKQRGRQQSQQSGQGGHRQQGGMGGEGRQQSQQGIRQQDHNRSHWDQDKSNRGQQQ
jgi:hypothetical protein